MIADHRGQRGHGEDGGSSSHGDTRCAPRTLGQLQGREERALEHGSSAEEHASWCPGVSRGVQPTGGVNALVCARALGKPRGQPTRPGSPRPGPGARAAAHPRAGTTGHEVCYTGPPRIGGTTAGPRPAPHGTDGLSGARHRGPPGQRAGAAPDHHKTEEPIDATSIWEDGRRYARRALARRHWRRGGGDDLCSQRREGELYGGRRS